MVKIPAGRLWMGSKPGKGTPDERPAFDAEFGAFCLDRTEVTVSAYLACVGRGACTPPRTGPVTCTATGSQRGNHPINCVTWDQATAHCHALGRRLPTEAEWEYAARGGDGRTYAWGDEEPDGRTCWNHPGTCAVGSFPPEAYGLVDMTGNVWEWVADGYGTYPWPPAESRVKVYRGGSWSRRFVKWMRVRLRNRWPADKRGSHLGFRCASTPQSFACPAARTDDGAGCRLVVHEVACSTGETWNGMRCAGKGEPVCKRGYDAVEGHGCVRDLDLARAWAKEVGHEEKGATPVGRARSPQFDEDCRTYQPSRPTAYRFTGGTHDLRTAAGKAAGCKNRDVGVGWNSSCCP